LSDFDNFNAGNRAKTNRPAYRQAGCFVVPPRKDTLIWCFRFVGNGQNLQLLESYFAKMEIAEGN
jgi:hypothetical protein